MQTNIGRNGLAASIAVAATFLVAGLLQNNARAGLVTLTIKKGDKGDTGSVIGKSVDIDPPAKVIFKFFDAPMPASDGILTVVAAGDLGIGMNDKGEQTLEDFISVFGEGNDEVGKTKLFKMTTDPLPPYHKSEYFPILDDQGKVIGKYDSGGFLINSKGQFLDKNGEVILKNGKPIENDSEENNKILRQNGVICGPNYHSITDDPFGPGVNVPAMDMVVIPRDKLEKLFKDGTIALTLVANREGTNGVGTLKYLDAKIDDTTFALRLTYTPVPEPPTLVLLGGGLLCLLCHGWRLRGTFSLE